MFAFACRHPKNFSQCTLHAHKFQLCVTTWCVLFHFHWAFLFCFEMLVERARHRHRNNMLPMMAFGMTALGMVVVPIGFQFLAVLGGKALLLAKMALLLASINGIKRVKEWFYIHFTCTMLTISFVDPTRLRQAECTMDSTTQIHITIRAYGSEAIMRTANQEPSMDQHSRRERHASHYIVLT